MFENAEYAQKQFGNDAGIPLAVVSAVNWMFAYVVELILPVFAEYIMYEVEAPVYVVSKVVVANAMSADDPLPDNCVLMQN